MNVSSQLSWYQAFVIVLPTTLLIPGPAYGQDACVSLLQHGIYDHVREENTAASAAVAQSNICTAYSKLKQDKVSASAKATYTVFSGSADYSQEQLEQVGSMMCAATYSASSASNAMSVIQDKISPDGASAFKECVQQYSDGLRAATTFDESDQSQITVTVRYVAPAGAPATTQFNHVWVNPPGSLGCTGSLVELKSGAQMSTQAYTATCGRAESATAFEFQGGKFYAKRASVVIDTAAGSITRTLTAKRAAPPPVPPFLPVGSIVPFAGTLEQAATLKDVGWWPCDGRLVNDPQSAVFAGKTTPNLVGRFIKGDSSSGTLGGATSLTVPAQKISSHTTGGFGAPTVHGDPYTHMNGPHTWNDESSVYSEGTASAQTIEYSPLFYSLVYLVKVK